MDVTNREILDSLGNFNLFFFSLTVIFYVDIKLTDGILIWFHS